MALTGAEWRLLGEVCVRLPVTAIAVRAMRLEGAVRLLSGGGARRSSDGSADLSADRTAALVNAAGLLLRASCLTRSVVLHGTLARRGLPTVLVVGAAKGGAGFTAHAWVERDGRVLSGSSADGFTPVWRSSAVAACLNPE